MRELVSLVSLYHLGRIWDFPKRQMGCNWSVREVLCDFGCVEGISVCPDGGAGRVWNGLGLRGRLKNDRIKPKVLLPPPLFPEEAWSHRIIRVLWGQQRCLGMKWPECPHHILIPKESGSCYLSGKPQSSSMPNLPQLIQISIGAPNLRQTPE